MQVAVRFPRSTQPCTRSCSLPKARSSTSAPFGSETGRPAFHACAPISGTKPAAYVLDPSSSSLRNRKANNVSSEQRAKATLSRRLVAEAVGTGLLLTAVVGSGIMGERLAGGNVALALLANAIATGAALVTLILTFGPISGAHFNPVVTLADASQ